MATSYHPVTLPPAGLVRALHLAALHSTSASVYQRSDDPTDGAEVREVWDDGQPATPFPVPLPSGWRPL